MSNVHHPRRRKRRPMNGVKTVDVIRGTLGYGFTISGQGPCTLSCIVSGSPAEAIGLKPGDFLLAVNGENVSKAPHDEVVRMIGTSVGTLTLQVAENVNNSDSSDEDIPQRQKFRHPHRLRSRQVGVNRVLKDHNSQQVEQVTATAVRKKPPISESLQSAALLKQKPPIGAGRRNVWDQENTGFTMQEPNLAFRNVYLNSHTSHFNNVQKVDKTDWVQKTVTNPADGQTASNAELSSRLHATRSSRSGRQSAPCNIAMSVDPEVSEEEWSFQCDPNVDKHFVVGYVGTIEMPGDKNSQHARLQSFHNAVRRLRLEKKIHTLVALTISVNGVKLTNAVRKVLAVYPVHRIMFCGICPDDNLYFGIVTSNCSNDGNESIRLEYAPSFSCHVFKVNTDIQAHYMHAQKARVFQFECTRSRDLRRCFEFPQTALPVIEPISALYRDRQNSQDNFPITQVFNEPSVTPVQNVAVNSSSSSSSSSNSDSGLGFGRDDSRNEAVFVVDMNQLPNDQYRMTNANRHSLPSQSLHQHLSPSVDTMPTPQSAFRSTSAANMHAQTKIISNNEDPKQGRLTLRAMPNPVLDLPSPFEQPNCSNTKVSDQNLSTTGILSYKYRSKQGVEHRSRSRETVSKMNSSNQRLSSGERKFEPRPLSAPYHQLSNGKLTVVTTCSSNTDFLDDKLSPRATPCNSKFKIRSPSAPPPGCATVEDSEFEQNVRRPLEEIFAIFDCDRNSETSVESANVRRFSEGFAAKLNKADSKPPINSSATHKWKKVGSFRRPKISKLSHSHESLVASGNDGLLPEKLGAANSINSIVNHDDGSNGCGREVSRVASWAVSFNRLLEDPAGVEVFTDFLQKEFSEENIHFWLAVDDFKRSLDVNKRNSIASEIFGKHLGPGASEPVNVDSLARQTAEQLLDKPTSTMFDAAQRQIFQLMKQDSYARFLKSEFYKTHLMAEMESKLPTSRTAVFTAVAMLHSKTGKEVDKKKSSKGKEEEKRRWSLLPWKQKTSKPSEMQKFRKFSKDESKKKPSLATMDLSLMRKEVVQGRESTYGNEDLRFCRVLLPDNSTAVVCAKYGQSIHQVLSHLFDKRNLTLESTEVFLLGSDKPLDLAEDMSILGSKEVLVERRTFFRVELPNQKIIGVKAKPNKLIYDVFRPILQKYGYKIDNITLQMTSDQGSLDLQIPVSSINDQQVLVVPKEDLLERPGAKSRAQMVPLTPVTVAVNSSVPAVVLHATPTTTSPTTTTTTTTTTAIVSSATDTGRHSEGLNSHSILSSPPPRPPPPRTNDCPDDNNGGDGDSDADTVVASNWRAARLSQSASLEEITNKVFEDLMYGKSAGCVTPLSTAVALCHPLDPSRDQKQAACREPAGVVRPCSATCVAPRRESTVPKGMPGWLSPSLPLDQFPVNNHVKSLQQKVKPSTHCNEKEGDAANGKAQDFLESRNDVPKCNVVLFAEGSNGQVPSHLDSHPKVSLEPPIPAAREKSKTTLTSIPKPKPRKKPILIPRQQKDTDISLVGSSRYQEAISRETPKLYGAKFSSNARCIKDFKTFGSPSDKVLHELQANFQETVASPHSSSAQDYFQSSPGTPLYNTEVVQDMSLMHDYSADFCNPNSTLAMLNFGDHLVPSTPIAASSPRNSTAPIASPEDLSPPPLPAKPKRFQKPSNKLVAAASPPPPPPQPFQETLYHTEKADFAPPPPLPQTSKKKPPRITNHAIVSYGPILSPASGHNKQQSHPQRVTSPNPNYPLCKQYPVIPSTSPSSRPLVFQLELSGTQNVSFV